MTAPLISICVPVLNEEENVANCIERVDAVFAQMGGAFRHEFVFTDNASTDATFAVLRKIAEERDDVRVYRFARNFGFQRSVLTALLKARGDAVIQIDCDLQDPPELFGEMLARWREGYDVVYGVRRSRPEPWHMRLLRAAFYRIVRMLSEHDVPVDAGDFRLIDRRVVESLRRVSDSAPYIRGTIAALGYRATGIPYDRSARESGRSKFNFLSLMAIAMDGVVSQSTLPLRAATIFGAVTVLLVLLVMAVLVGMALFTDTEWPSGFGFLAFLMLVSVAINSIFLGIIGEYVGRLFQGSRSLPIPVVVETLNDESEHRYEPTISAGPAAAIAHHESDRGAL